MDKCCSFFFSFLFSFSPKLAHFMTIWAVVELLVAFQGLVSAAREGQRKALGLADVLASEWQFLDLVVAVHSPQFTGSALLKNPKTKFHYDSLAIEANSVLKIPVLVQTISKEFIYFYLFLVYVVPYWSQEPSPLSLLGWPLGLTLCQSLWILLHFCRNSQVPLENMATLKCVCISLSGRVGSVPTSICTFVLLLHRFCVIGCWK